MVLISFRYPHCAAALHFFGANDQNALGAIGIVDRTRVSASHDVAILPDRVDANFE
jgi:hypothetical protein